MSNKFTPLLPGRLVSIIEPVYNVEKYIRRNLECVLSQTYANFELILVDDGSTDSSGKICDEFSKRDERIKVIHQENGGVAAARQAGTNLAQGEFLIHCDPDDWVEPEWIERLLETAEEDQADVVICDFYISTDKQDLLCSQRPSALEAQVVLADVMKRRLYGALWNKLIRRTCFQKYNVHFIPNINVAEDSLVLAQLLQHNEIKVAYVALPLYHYYRRSDSITQDLNTWVIDMSYAMLDELDKVLPAELHHLSRDHRIGFDLFLWSQHQISFKKLRMQHLTLSEIWGLPIGKKSQVAYSMAFLGMERLGRFILKMRKFWK